MNQATNNESPAKGIWLRFLLLLPLVAIMAVLSHIHVQSVSNTYKMWTPIPLTNKVDFANLSLEKLRITPTGVIEATDIEHYETGAACITFKAVADGTATVSFEYTNPEDAPGSEQHTITWDFRVTHGAIIENNANFTGWESIHLCVTILFITTTILFASVLIRLVRTSWYGYEMVAAGGGLLFSLFQSLLFLYILLNNSLNSITDVATTLSSAIDFFLWSSFVPMGLLALFVSISNISLIRHEGKRLVNLLGIAASVTWALAYFLWTQWWDIGFQLPLSPEVLVVGEAFVGVAIAFGECLLLSTIVCAWLASRHVPDHGADYLIVLGCGIFADGKPSPLLAGRIDRARDFDTSRVEAGDAPATFVPSGGQGPDEVMSEAQSMGNYLVEHGVAADRIVLEDRSATTRENMAYSREVIERHAGRDVSEATVAFATTNYHVFRGYVCAHQAGMVVEGMGSKTKAYFWPNAFLREFAGLLVAQRKSILLVYLILAIIYAVMQYILLLT